MVMHEPLDPSIDIDRVRAEVKAKHTSALVALATGQFDVLDSDCTKPGSCLIWRTLVTWAPGRCEFEEVMETSEVHEAVVDAYERWERCR